MLQSLLDQGRVLDMGIGPDMWSADDAVGGHQSVLLHLKDRAKLAPVLGSLPPCLCVACIHFSTRLFVSHALIPTRV